MSKAKTTFRKVFRVCKILAIVLVCSLIVAQWPGLVFGTAKAIVWSARTITGGADLAFALVNGPNG